MSYLPRLWDFNGSDAEEVLYDYDLGQASSHLKVSVVLLRGHQPVVCIAEYNYPANAPEKMLRTRHAIYLTTEEWAELLKRRDIIESLLQTPGKLPGKNTLSITPHVSIEIKSTVFIGSQNAQHYSHYVYLVRQGINHPQEKLGIILGTRKWLNLMEFALPAIRDTFEKLEPSAYECTSTTEDEVVSSV
jgi:hypothetical protein